MKKQGISVLDFRFQKFVSIRVHSWLLCFLLCASIALGIKPRDRTVLSKPVAIASMTSATLGQWSVSGCTSNVDIHTNAETITVPAGNSGSIRVHTANNTDLPNRYKINSGSFINLTNNGDTTFTVANGDTITFDVPISTNCATAVSTIGPDTGTVFDATTGATLDTYSITF